MLREQWDRDGFIIVRSVVGAGRVNELRRVIEHVLTQYLEFDPDAGQPGDPDANSVRHLHRPEYFRGPESREAFARLMDIASDPAVLEIVEATMGERPLFRDTSLWFNPFFVHRDGHWHRDLQYVVGSDEEERKKLLEDRDFASCAMQFQIPLVPSDDVEVVPGSHLRWDTPEEYEVRKADNCKNRCSNAMPGAHRLRTRPGDILALNPAGIHRGRYHADKIRRTLQLTYTAWNRLDDYSSAQSWFLEPSYLDGLRGKTREYFDDCRSAIYAHRESGGKSAFWHP